MSGKVKVSKEVAEALHTLLENHSKDHIMFLVGDRGQHSIRRFDEEAVVLLRKRTSPLELAKMLIDDYEVEQTPEEEITRKYDTHFGSEQPFDRGIARGIEITLEAFNIQIKGVNF